MNPSRSQLGLLRQRAKRGIVLEAIAWLTASLCGYTLVSFAVDRGLRLEVGARAALLALFAVGVVWLVRQKLWRPLGVELSDEELALAVERADPTTRQAFISAVQFETALADPRPGVESAALMRAVVDDVQQRAGELGFGRALNGERLRRVGLALAVSAVLPLGWLLADPASVRVWAARNLALGSVEWPRATRLSFVDLGPDDTLRVAAGDDVTVVVLAEGVIPDSAVLRHRLSGGETGAETMTLTGLDRFNLTLTDVLEPMELVAEGGDGRTPPLRLDVVARPLVELDRVVVSYPDYMGLPAATVDQAASSEIRAPEGARLELIGRSSKPLRSAWLTLAEDQRRSAGVDPDDPTSLRAELVPEATGPVTLHVEDLDRLDAAQPPQIFVRRVADAPPTVAFEPVGIGAMIVPGARIPGVLSASDDYGLRALSARFRVRRGDTEEAAAAVDEWRDVIVSGLDGLPQGAREHRADVALDLRQLDGDGVGGGALVAQPGDFLTLQFAATDSFGPGTPHRGESDALVFRVVTPKEMLDELQRRQAQQRSELERVLTEERARLDELRRIRPPVAGDPEVERVREHVWALARTQRSLGIRVASVADHIEQLLAEWRNNRLLEPGQGVALQGEVLEPLQQLARRGFPSSAEAVQEFGEAGAEDLRAVGVRGFEANVRSLERILAHIAEMRDLAALLQTLRRVMDLHDSAILMVEQQRQDAAGSLFDPPPEREKSGDLPKERNR
ncbi:MAG: hypothetical protein AAF628_06415 [Planctomycetota bacterium]